MPTKHDPLKTLRFAPNQHIRHRRVEQSDQGDALELGESFLLTMLAPIEQVPPEDLPVVLARPDMLVDRGNTSAKPWEPSPALAMAAVVFLATAVGLMLIYLAYRIHG